MSYDQIEVPDDGEKITVDEETGELSVPDNPIIPIIHGDGIGTDVGPAAQKVLDAAAEATGRSVSWMRVYAGSSARDKYDENLPEDTVSAIRNHRVAIKGPLTTPVGAGFRSLNVALRKKLDLYANVRPTYHLDGVPSPVKNPSAMDMVTFRENTEDVYAGIEWEAGTDEVQQVKEFVEDEMGATGVIHDGPVGIGIKPITEFGTKRLVREAIEYALENDRDSVTLVHKGNIMKFTEGAFRDWGYELAEEEFGDVTITEDELWEEYDGEQPEDKIVVKDRIADNMLQQLLTRTADYEVIDQFTRWSIAALLAMITCSLRLQTHRNNRPSGPTNCVSCDSIMVGHFDRSVSVASAVSAARSSSKRRASATSSGRSGRGALSCRSIFSDLRVFSWAALANGTPLR